MTPNPADILGTMTDAAAGAALGVSKTTATRLRRAAGIPPCGRRADGDATRARVLAALDGEWRTTREVAERAGVSVSTARVVLNHLCDHELAELHTGVWNWVWRVPR